MRLYLNVDDVGINEVKDWTVELCGNDTQSGSDSGDFYSSSSRAVLELHTSHHHRHYRHHHHHQQQQQQQQQQGRDRRRPRFRGFRGTFRFLPKGHYTCTHKLRLTFTVGYSKIKQGSSSGCISMFSVNLTLNTFALSCCIAAYWCTLS